MPKYRFELQEGDKIILDGKGLARDIEEITHVFGEPAILLSDGCLYFVKHIKTIERITSANNNQ